MPRHRPPTTPPAPLPPPLRTLTACRSQLWTPIISYSFPYTATSFLQAVSTMISHPEHSSTWILRSTPLPTAPIPVSAPYFTATQSLVRQLLPRNPARDAPATQTIHFLTSTSADGFAELVLLLPHGPDVPYYLPATRGTAFLLREGALSVLYALDETHALTARLERTALHLVARALKLAGNPQYAKRVAHDVVVAREAFQDRYLGLRGRHAARLVSGWREKTDARKHVFEDILIAAFVVEVWTAMGWREGEGGGFPGFVDLGCGNGVLVDVLVREGWSGCGVDARARKSWEGFEERTRGVLREGLLVPWVLDAGCGEPGILDGRFPKDTFLIANHADELTAWTPLLARACGASGFLAIPCCSHDLSGAKARFNCSATSAVDDGVTGDCGDPKKAAGQVSMYAGLCSYVEKLAEDAGWVVEKEVLRIPSTRNVGILGRRLRQDGRDGEEVVREILEREGGGVGWVERTMALRKGEGSGH